MLAPAYLALTMVVEPYNEIGSPIRIGEPIFYP